MVWLPNFNEFAASVGPMLGILLILMALDLLLGLIVALKKGVFEWAKLADYVTSSLGKIVFWVAWAFVEALLKAAKVLSNTVFAVPLDYSSEAIFITLLLAQLGSIAGHGAALGVLKDQLPKVGIRATGD